MLSLNSRLSESTAISKQETKIKPKGRVISTSRALSTPKSINFQAFQKGAQTYTTKTRHYVLLSQKSYSKNSSSNSREWARGEDEEEGEEEMIMMRRRICKGK
jgi:hypothetical protein